MIKYPFLAAFVLAAASCNSGRNVVVAGELMQWHPVTLTFTGPATSEDDSINPFLDYRLDVVFRHGDKKYLVPGYFAADGNAGETGAGSGNKWRAVFCPVATGKWTFEASFRHGNAVAVDDDERAGKPVYFDGTSGVFRIVPSDKNGRDFRSRGRLVCTGERYLKFSGTGEYFLKGGAGSPENFLAYSDFDGTYKGDTAEGRAGEAESTGRLHSYRPHSGDWKEGDPQWRGGKGRNIIGALNYLASRGVNSVYMLTMNVGGDGRDVWPWTGYDERYRFDCSKLDQWEIVFRHMDSLGIMQHFVTQETENETLLDGGDTGIQRRLYYRELVARFAHHPAVTWNLGEENGPAGFSPVGQSTRQRKEMAAFLKKLIPYNSFIVVHTHSDPALRHRQMNEMLGCPDLDGLSLQMGNPANSHKEILRWLSSSTSSGKTWVCTVDETGPANEGVKPDSDDPQHDLVRKEALWGNLMAGGGGVDWYFGYRYHDNDLDCEDWRSRDIMWKQTSLAKDFFHEHLPFHNMTPADSLCGKNRAFCLVLDGEVYAVYLPEGGQVQLDLSATSGNYTIHWFDPRNGGPMQQGSVEKVKAGKWVETGLPPGDPGSDWLMVVRRETVK